jgi:hypothetical protein
MKRFALYLSVFMLIALSTLPRALAANLDNHGGPTMQAARVHFIFWLPPGTTFDPTAADGTGNYQTLEERFVNDLSASAYLNVMTQYPGQCGTNQCVLDNRAGVVSLGGSFLDTRAYPHAGTVADPLQDADIQAEVTHAIAARGWTAGPDAIFFVLTGAGIEECSGSSCTFNAFCAYHGAFNAGNIIYSYLSDASFNSAGCGEGIATGVNGQLSSDREIALMSHEFFEAIDDPRSDLSAWWSSTDGNEGGDNCNQLPATVVLNGNSYNTQQQWSNDTSSCVSSFGPSVQFNISTGGDDLRGDSTATASLARLDASSIQTVALKAQSEPSWNGGTGHIVVAGYDGGNTELANLGVTLASHSNLIETDDNWNINGLTVKLLSSTGDAICEQDLAGNPLTRLTGSDPTATFSTPNCSPAPAAATFDHVTFNIVTGGDDLRGDSEGTAQIAFVGSPAQTFTLKAQSDPSWDNGSTHIRTFALSSPQPLSAIFNITITKIEHNGFTETDDNWNIQTVNITLSGPGGQSCLFSAAGDPFVRLTGTGNFVVLTPASGC